MSAFPANASERPDSTASTPTPGASSADNLAWTEIISSLRHDLRNTLTPALLSADLLSSHEDTDVRDHAETILQALERTLACLAATKKS